jgi:hypothetical protein
VRLVDDEHADPAHEGGQLLLAERGVVEPLRRHQEHVDLVAVQLREHVGPLVRVRRVDRDRTHAGARSAAAIWSRMSASSGETSTVGPAPSCRSSRVATK